MNIWSCNKDFDDQINKFSLLEQILHISTIVKYYSISSLEMYKKNKLILKAGKTKPTSGTKIEGKKAAVIILFLFFYF